jgi:hypothetical protein
MTGRSRSGALRSSDDATVAGRRVEGCELQRRKDVVVPEPAYCIRGMRNVLIRMYFGVDSAVVRDVVETKLQPLDEALARYVGQQSGLR